MGRDPAPEQFRPSGIGETEVGLVTALLRLLAPAGSSPVAAHVPARALAGRAGPLPRRGHPVARGREHERRSALTTATDDAGLIRAAGSDPAAFGILYERYVDQIFRYCLVRLPTPADAEDAAATTFARAWAGIAAFQPRDDLEGGGVRPWLYAIAHNVIASRYRGDRLAVPIESAESVHDPAAPPDEQAIAAERRAVLRRTIAGLSEDQRRVVELRLAGLSGPEIAVALGRSHGAVKMLQLRAVDRLRTLLGDRLSDEPPAVAVSAATQTDEGVSRDQR